MKLIILFILICGTLGSPSRRTHIRPRVHLGVVGGQNAQPGEFPYMLSFQEKLLLGLYYFHFCGASIYNERTSITAGHCVYGEDYDNPEGLYVVAGEYNLLLPSGDEQRIKVAQITPHEDFDYSTLNNDIALLKGESIFTFNDLVGPVVLPSQGQQTTGTCTVIGWGALYENGPSPIILQKVDVPVVSDEECSEDYSGTDFQESWLCAGEEGKDSCQGDSGGPLICSGYLGGIVSWGIGCAQAGYPGIYTEVSYFVDWIVEHSWS